MGTLLGFKTDVSNSFLYTLFDIHQKINYCKNNSAWFMFFVGVNCWCTIIHKENVILQLPD